VGKEWVNKILKCLAGVFARWTPVRTKLLHSYRFVLRNLNKLQSCTKPGHAQDATKATNASVKCVRTVEHSWIQKHVLWTAPNRCILFRSRDMFF